MRSFYVYVYLDTRKPGKFNYGNFEFNFKPFYVGKGCGNRSESMLNRSTHFLNTIKSIRSNNLEPVVLKVINTIDESVAYEEEKNLIKLIGLDNLTNISHGGVGVFSGLHHSEESKSKISRALMGNTHLLGHSPTNETRTKISISMSGDRNHFFGKSHSEESKALISAKKTGQVMSKEVRQAMSDFRRGNKSYGRDVSGDKNPMVGRTWYNNGTKNLAIPNGSSIPDGYMKGMLKRRKSV